MRRVEDSDLRSLRWAEQVDAGLAACALRLGWHGKCGGGTVWIVGVGEFVVELWTTQLVAEALDRPPVRYRRRQLRALDELDPLAEEVSCDHASAVVDVERVRALVSDVRARRVKMKSLVSIPVL